MSLVIDGDRCKRYLPAGKRLVALAREIGVAAMTTVRNGFRIKGWQQDGLQKITINSPMGAAVLCSTDSGIKLLTADNWQGDFSGARDYFTGTLGLDEDMAYLAWGHNVPPVDEETPGVGKFIPLADTTTAFNYNTGANVSGPSSPVCPSLAPLGVEAFWVGVCGSLAYGTPAYRVYENSLNYYASSGETVKRFGEYWRFPRDRGRRTAVQVLPYSGTLRTVYHNPTAYFLSDGGEKSCAFLARWKAGYLPWRYILCAEVFAGMPDDLLGLLLPRSETNGGIIPVGSYAHAATGEDFTMLHAANFDRLAVATVKSYTDSRPWLWPWQMFFSIFDGQTNVIHSSAQFIDILDDFSGGRVKTDGVVTDGGYAVARAIWRLLLPRPNYNSRAPFDSAMFHGINAEEELEEGETPETCVYTWTRKYGAVKFSASGLFKVELALPLEVTENNGVRPDITHAGGGTYLCVCTKEVPGAETDAITVVGVYHGSPFGEWARLPDPDGTLLHVRPAKVTAEDVQLLGVLAKVNPETELAEFFFCAFLGGAWRKMGKLDVQAPAFRANWSVVVFGDGPAVASMKNYPSPPPILMQMPNLPYSEYEGLMP